MYTGPFPATTNWQDWTIDFSIIDPETGEPLDVSDVTEIKIEILEEADCDSALLSASLTDDTVALTDGTDSTVTMTIATPAVVSWIAHGLAVDSIVVFDTSGALPTNVTAGTIYYVIAAGLTANAFQFSASIGGSAVNTSGTQSGVHTARSGEIGLIHWSFTEAQMSDLAAKAHHVRGRLTHSNGEITQFIRASLPVLAG